MPTPEPLHLLGGRGTVLPVYELAAGHTISVERRPVGRFSRPGEQPWHAVCTCGEFAYTNTTDWKADPTEELLDTNAVAEFVERHTRIANGEKGIYGCGCLVNPEKRRRKCWRHDKEYIPRTVSRYKKASMSSAEILRCLGFQYVPPEWAFFTELRIGTGWRYETGGTVDPKWEQRIDAWALNTWPSKKCHRIAFEVKVSRNDFRKETAQPDKRAAALSLSHQFYFVTPLGLVDASEIPDDCGLIEIKPTGGRKFTVKAPHHERDDDAPWRFVASLARRVEREQPSPQEALSV